MNPSNQESERKWRQLIYFHRGLTYQNRVKTIISEKCVWYNRGDMKTKLPKPVRTVTNFEEGCNLAYEAGHPIVAFVTEQQRRYKFFPSRIYRNVDK